MKEKDYKEEAELTGAKELLRKMLSPLPENDKKELLKLLIDLTEKL